MKRDERDIGSQLIAAGKLADLLELSAERIRQLHDEGHIPSAGRGKYRLADAVRGYVKFLKDRKPARDSEHSRLARAQAIKVEMENLQRRGKILPAPMVSETLQIIAAAFVSQRAGQAGRLANELAHITDPASIRERILEDWRIILADIETIFKDRAAALEATEDGSDDPAASEEADAERVGGAEPDVPSGQRGAREVSGLAHTVLRADSGGLRGSPLSTSGRGDGNADG